MAITQSPAAICAESPNLASRQRMLRHLRQLDQRAVGERIAADHLGGVGVVVFVAEELHFDLGRVLDHVVVGEDEAVLRVDDEAGAGGGRLLLALGPAAAARRLSC